MEHLALLLWVWVIAGLFAVHAHADRLQRDVDLLTALILVLAWPWWLRHHRDPSEGRRPTESLVPVRVEAKDRKARKR